MRAALILLLAFAPLAHAVKTQRSDTPERWLLANAPALLSTDLVPYSHDLEPLRPLAGNRTIVALGDATHGSHELYTVKLRAIDFLVRELNFDVVALEGPFPTLNRIDAYVQGGAGDPRALLADLKHAIYPFWNSEELLAVIEWLRAYNVVRGSHPAVHIGGIDPYEMNAAAAEVVAYLRSVDPAAAAETEVNYACARGQRVHEELAAREAELVTRTGAAAFHEALQYARIVAQGRSGDARDEALAENALWMREHRSATGKIIVWAHNGHVAEVANAFAKRPMGALLRSAVGDDYLAIGTLAGGGSFIGWTPPPNVAVTRTFAPLREGMYETLFRRRTAIAQLIPLNETSWLPEEMTFNAAGSGDKGATRMRGRLADLFDAVIYVETTTPLRLLP
ncbi:MAG TPA: erythromycin esterase family protein [Thermoanaerobaculia bacterium]|nr:erythromycin esterase family protein [Thermoanaerobaculia bacterium]